MLSVVLRDSALDPAMFSTYLACIAIPTNHRVMNVCTDDITIDATSDNYFPRTLKRRWIKFRIFLTYAT